MSKKGARMSMEQAVALAKRTGNADLLRQLEAPRACVSAPAKAPEAGKGADIPKAAKTREMSKTEREFEAILKIRFPAAEITWEKIIFQLAPGLRYIPDLCVEHKNGQHEFWEIKAGWLFKGAHKSHTQATLTKPKVAAQLFRFQFHIAEKIEGEWKETRLPGKAYS